jgi:phosphatidylserine/phosphatidylglycerophosphate/cardiolipin synthase-like enzyme
MKKIIAIVLLLSASIAYGETYQVCFTPGQDCTALIVNSINNAKQSIYVQAYSFTSAPIAQALVDAKKRNIEVDVILDKSQSKANKYTSSTYLMNNHIPVWIDYKPAIAHNKVMIIDKAVVITGSFNFTAAAQFKNAENLLIISDTALANKYLTNWNNRKEQSRVGG